MRRADQRKQDLKRGRQIRRETERKRGDEKRKREQGREKMEGEERTLTNMEHYLQVSQRQNSILIKTFNASKSETKLAKPVG